AVFLGAGIGILLIALQRLIGQTAISLLSASDDVKQLVGHYFYIRIWGAPATLITFSLLGTFIGMGWTKHLLFVQLFLNGLNIILNILLVVGYDLGVRGIAWGTVIAEWCSVFFAFNLLLRKLRFDSFVQRLQQLQARVFDKRSEGTRLNSSHVKIS